MKDFTKLSKEEIDAYDVSVKKVKNASSKLSEDLEVFAANLQRFAAAGINLKDVKHLRMF